MPINLEELTKGTSIRPDELKAGTKAFNARRESFQRAAQLVQVLEADHKLPKFRESLKLDPAAAKALQNYPPLTENLNPRLRNAVTATQEPKRPTAAAARKVEPVELDHNARKRGDRTSMER